MNHSEQIDQITVALSKAQSAIKNPTKDSYNPFHKSHYATLANVLECCREPLSKNGLAVAQVLEVIGEKQALVTILSHTSGQWIKSTILLPINKLGPQEVGICITYCRRYALAAIVGIHQEDDDAESAEKPFRRPPEEDPNIIEDRNAASGKSISISEKQRDFLDSLLDRLNDVAIEESICKSMKINSIYDVPRERFDGLLTWLKQKIEEKKGKQNGPAVERMA